MSILHNPLHRFLILSIALHLGLLATHSVGLPDLPPSNFGQRVLDVHLTKDTLRSAPKPPVSKVIVRSSSSRDAVARPTTMNSETASVSVSTTDAGREPESPQTGADAGLQNQLLGELKTRLSRHLVYPPLARSRGWQGTVVVGLKIESDGRLEKIRVERGSGYAVLDHSTLVSLNRVGRLTEASAWLDGRSMEMQLPVIYRLTEY